VGDAVEEHAERLQIPTTESTSRAVFKRERFTEACACRGEAACKRDARSGDVQELARVEESLLGKSVAMVLFKYPKER